MLMESRPPTNELIATSHLTKRYGEHDALVDANITVGAGVVYGFLGPNGAGKTTLIRLLLGFIRPTSGVARMFGHDTWRDGVEARRNIGYLVPASGLYPDLSGNAQLDYAARLSGRLPILREQTLDALELARPDLERKLGSYSKGMRQKLALTAAMQSDPELLILDEPTDGLDPLIQRNFEELIRTMRDRGRTVFMSSHDLAEVERVCERVAVVRSGRIVAEETIANLQERHASRVTVKFRAETPDHLAQVPGVTIHDQRDGRVELLVTGDPNPLMQLIAAHPVDEITIERASLEDIFMTYYEAGA